MLIIEEGGGVIDFFSLLNLKHIIQLDTQIVALEIQKYHSKVVRSSINLYQGYIHSICVNQNSETNSQ